MSYQVIARKWRPQTFEDLVGQQHVTETLKNAIKSDRVAHAYIFSGVRGVGKTTAARILAKALNCVKGPTQFRAFAKMRAAVVFPTPRTPEKMYACATRSLLIAFFSVSVTCCCPTRSSNVCGRHLRAMTW